MSTASKLDPRVRRARTDRRNMIVALSAAPLNAPGAVLYSVLERIRRDSRAPGEWKQVLFDDNLVRYEQKHKLRPAPAA